MSLPARGALLATWLLLTAAGAPAPTPPHGVANGVTGTPRSLDTAVADLQAAGFDSVRLFVRWDLIETVEAAPDWTCRYLTSTDVGPDRDRDGRPDPWPGTPCDAGPCGCGYSIDERIAAVAHTTPPLSIVLTIVGTPAWARGQPADFCPRDAPARAFPLRRGKEDAYRDFVSAVARRYGAVAYAFELWNEPDLDGCHAWAGTRQQYQRQILSAATAVKATGVLPGLVVAPTLEAPSAAAMDAWIDWSQPIDRVSFNLYSPNAAAAIDTLATMHRWCRARAGCTGFYVTEFGAQAASPRCPGPYTPAPGAADVAIMRWCRRHRRCSGLFLYSLSDQNDVPECRRGLLSETGCRKGRLCTIAKRFFGVTPPFDCRGCGP